MDTKITSTFNSGAASVQQVYTIDAEASLALTLGIHDFAYQLAKGIKEQFIAGGHDLTGASLQTVQVEIGTRKAVVHLGGGMGFVEGGFPAHWIGGNPVLHWTDQGMDGFATQVWNPGYKGDPFIERAMDDLNYDAILGNMARLAFSKVRGAISTGSASTLSEEDQNMIDSTLQQDIGAESNALDSTAL